jgi:hypothetical protein
MLLLTALPDNILSKIAQDWKSTDFILVGRVNRELHRQTRGILLEASTIRIQRFMCWCRTFASTRLLAKAFERCNFSERDMLGIGFVEIKHRIRCKKVFHAVRKLVDRLHSLSWHTLSGGDGVRIGPSSRINVGMVLLAFLVRYHPVQCFSELGERETAVFEASCQLTNCLCAMSAHLAAPGNSFYTMHKALVEKFPRVLMVYLDDYITWKEPDFLTLVSRIGDALHALRMAAMDIPVETPLNSPLRAEFRTQIRRLRAKLLEIGGEEATDVFIADSWEGLELADARAAMLLDADA